MAEPVTRVTFHSPTGTSEDFTKLAERIGLHGVNYAVGFSAWLDINPEGVSKGSALEQIRRRLDVQPMHTVAVGDQRNDVEMLTWAARGVAMGNAPDEVKAIAKEVTADVYADGLAPRSGSGRFVAPAGGRSREPPGTDRPVARPASTRSHQLAGQPAHQSRCRAAQSTRSGSHRKTRLEGREELELALAAGVRPRIRCSIAPSLMNAA